MIMLNVFSKNIVCGNTKFKSAQKGFLDFCWLKLIRMLTKIPVVLLVLINIAFYITGFKKFMLLVYCYLAHINLIFVTKLFIC